MADSEQSQQQDMTKEQAQHQINGNLQVKVFSQGKTYFSDEAKTVSAQNQTGPFDILAGHANFLSLVSKGDIAIRTVDDDIEQIPVTRGVVHVINNNVKVFLDV